MADLGQLFNMQPDPATANYDLDVMTEFRKTRYDESIAKNPYFTCECAFWLSESRARLTPLDRPALQRQPRVSSDVYVHLPILRQPHGDPARGHLNSGHPDVVHVGPRNAG